SHAFRGMFAGGWPAPAGHLPRYVEIGSLFWPFGSSRFAIGRFLATDNELAQIRPLAVVITAGLAQSRVDGYWHVAKAVLISNMKVLLEQGRLKFSRGLPETKTLVRELENYRTKITPAANETWNAREGAHDDLLLAVAISVWLGHRPRHRF